MTERRPLVVIDGQVQELPNGDTVPGTSGGGGGGLNVTHTEALYWRLNNIVVNGGSVVGLSELEFRGKSAAAIIPSVVTAVSEFSSTYSIEKAFKGSTTAEYLGSGAPSSEIITAQFSSPVSVKSIWIRARSGSSNAQQAIVSFNLEYSNNGTDWTIAASSSEPVSPYDSLESRSFDFYNATTQENINTNNNSVSGPSLFAAVTEDKTQIFSNTAYAVANWNIGTNDLTGCTYNAGIFNIIEETETLLIANCARGGGYDLAIAIEYDALGNDNWIVIAQAGEKGSSPSVAQGVTAATTHKLAAGSRIRVQVSVRQNQWSSLSFGMLSTGGDAAIEYPNMIGNQGKILAVNSTEDGVEWIDASVGNGGSGSISEVTIIPWDDYSTDLTIDLTDCDEIQIITEYWRASHTSPIQIILSTDGTTFESSYDIGQISVGTAELVNTSSAKLGIIAYGSNSVDQFGVFTLFGFKSTDEKTFGVTNLISSNYNTREVGFSEVSSIHTHLRLEAQPNNTPTRGRIYVRKISYQNVSAIEFQQESIDTATYNTVNADFSGNKFKLVRQACTITIEPGHTKTNPCTFVPTTSGMITFTAGTGVTLISTGGLLSSRVQGSPVKVVQDKDNLNTYLIIGDLG